MTSFFDEQWKKSTTFKFWNVFLNAMQGLLLNIRSERIGDLNFSLKSQCQMLPHIFLSDKINNSRWLPVYLLDILHLPEDLQSVFKSGQLSIHLNHGKFNGIWTDMGIEKTVVLIQQKSALVCWSLTWHILGEYIQHVRTNVLELQRMGMIKCTKSHNLQLWKEMKSMFRLSPNPGKKHDWPFWYWEPVKHATHHIYWSTS